MSAFASGLRNLTQKEPIIVWSCVLGGIGTAAARAAPRGEGTRGDSARRRDAFASPLLRAPGSARRRSERERGRHSVEVVVAGAKGADRRHCGKNSRRPRAAAHQLPGPGILGRQDRADAEGQPGTRRARVGGGGARTPRALTRAPTRPPAAQMFGKGEAK